jgi:nucleoside-diphosphate-sugar epimerase
MSTLLCFGLGYCAERFIGMYGDGYARIFGTVRGAERAAVLNARYAGRLRAVVFDGSLATPDMIQAIAAADFALISVPPREHNDPVVNACYNSLVAAPRLRSIVYLSTIGVYGDRDGKWVDEQAPAVPASARARARLEAERAWQDLGIRRGTAVAILRLAGIYGPGRNALVQIMQGDARRILKPGHVFNRVHVDDIAQAIDAAFAQKASGIFNVTDDEPSAQGDPLAFAAQLMGVPPPPELPYEEALPSMTPMAKSFWQECRRVRNDKIKRELGVALQNPTYREGLRALFEERK